MVLLNQVEKMARDASLKTHLQSFDSPIAVEDEQPSLETPT